MVNFIVLLIMAGSGIFLVWFGRLWLQAADTVKRVEQQLDMQGVDADAEIVNHRFNSGRRGGVYHFITYQYPVKKVDGQIQKFTNESAVSGRDYDRLKLGDHIAVRYLPDDPKTVRPASGVRETFGASNLRLSGMICVVVGALVIVAGFVMFIGFTLNDNAKAATATAETLLRSATPNVAQKTATAQGATATAQRDQATVSQVRDALTSRIAEWKKVSDRVMHRVFPPETGLDLNEVEIDYGHCANGTFYLYAWLRISERIRIGDETDTFFDGYGFVEGSTPPNCYPKELSQVWLRDAGSLGNNWYAVSGATEVKSPKP